MDVYEQKSATNPNTFYHMEGSGKITVIGIQADRVHSFISCSLTTRCLLLEMCGFALG